MSKQTFRDLNVSGFKGKNRLKGALSIFIQLVKENRLARQPVLILEAFDRWSRQDIDESERALIDLLKCGVDIHVAFNNKTFTAESTKSLPDRIEILVALKSAYEFSANLSKRIKAAKQSKLAQIQSGQIVKHNNVPKYFSWNDEKKRYEHNDRVTLVKELVREYLSGHSLYRIAGRLNRERVPSMKTGGHWSPRSLKCIFTNRVLLGEYMGNPRFFQPIIDADTFNRLQMLLKQNTHNRGAASELVNIFKGLLYCKCGCRMNVVSQSIDYRTKKKWAKAYRYARCYSVGVGSPCEHRFCIPLEQIEEEFFVHCVMMDPRQMLSKTDNAEKKALNNEISRNQAKFHLLTQQIKKLLDLSQTFDLSELKQKLAALEKQRETTKTETTPIEFDDIKRIVSDFHSSLKKGIDDSESKAERAFNEMVWKIQEILKDNDIRRQLQVMLPRVIGKLVVDSVANVFQVFNHSGKCVYTSLGLA